LRAKLGLIWHFLSISSLSSEVLSLKNIITYYLNDWTIITEDAALTDKIEMKKEKNERKSEKREN